MGPPPPRPAAAASRTAPPRALTEPEQQVVLDTLHSERFRDATPAQVYATLLDEGTFLCSERTMYRLLATADEVRERRALARHPAYQRPELLAERPNEVWSWDITKLLGPAKWTYFYLYVVLNIFSRYVVGWMVAHRENPELARRFIAESAAKEGIDPDQLTRHADRGSSMTSGPVALLLSDLAITKTHSRPHVSNDNPYSESHFKTLKYRPEFPERFATIEEARAFCQAFFRWYNTGHRHTGQAATIDDARATVLAAAYTAHPERFVRRAPLPPPLPTAAWINRPVPSESEEVTH